MPELSYAESTLINSMSRLEVVLGGFFVGLELALQGSS
jgi:hypothetical protein